MDAIQNCFTFLLTDGFKDLGVLNNLFILDVLLQEQYSRDCRLSGGRS